MSTDIHSAFFSTAAAVKKNVLRYLAGLCSMLVAIMDNLRIFIFFMMVLGISLEVSAGCAETLQNDRNFQACVMGYSQYIADGAQRMDPNDPNGMINLMCSKTGTEKIQCVINYIKTCPALMTTGDSAAILNNLQAVERMGGFEQMCSLLSDLGNTGNSPEIDTGCAQTLQNDANFKACMMGYSKFIVDGTSRVDPNDPNGMISLLCSKTGTEKVKCAINYTKTCPALMTTGESAAILNSLQAVERMGSFEQMCSLIAGTGPSSPCQAVSQCIEVHTKDAGSSSPPDGRTPFSSFQFYTGYICGPLRRMLECFKDTGDQCSDLLNNFKERMDMERTKMGSDVTLPTFEEIKRFTLQECSKIPADFSSNTCVRQNLARDKFVKCFQNISANYPTEENQASCNQYRAGHQCVSMTVGKKCGDQYTNAIEKLTPLFMVGIPRNCELEASEPSDSSGQIRMSSVAMLVALVLSLKLK